MELKLKDYEIIIVALRRMLKEDTTMKNFEINPWGFRDSDTMNGYFNEVTEHMDYLKNIVKLANHFSNASLHCYEEPKED